MRDFKFNSNVILDPATEKVLDRLDPNWITINETKKIGELATCSITHPLVIDNNEDYTRYDKVLVTGNYVFLPQTLDDVPMLYVIREKKIDVLGNLCELTCIEYSAVLGEAESVLIDYKAKTALTSVMAKTFFGDWFEIGDVSISPRFSYSGAIGPLDLLRLIEDEGDCEFSFNYEVNKENKLVKTIHVQEKIGKEWNELIEIGRNTDTISMKLNDNNVATAVAPKMEFKDSANQSVNVITLMSNWRDKSVTAGTLLDQGMYKNDSGQWVRTTQDYAPFTKVNGSMLLQLPDNMLNSRIYQKNYKLNGNLQKRVKYSEENEEHVNNLYWRYADLLTTTIMSSVSIDCNIADLKLIKEDEQWVPLNVGDYIYIKVNDFNIRLKARVVGSSKDSKDKSKIDYSIGTVSANIIDILAGKPKKPTKGEVEFLDVDNGGN